MIKVQRPNIIDIKGFKLIMIVFSDTYGDNLISIEAN